MGKLSPIKPIFLTTMTREILHLLMKQRKLGLALVCLTEADENGWVRKNMTTNTKQTNIEELLTNLLANYDKDWQGEYTYKITLEEAIEKINSEVQSKQIQFLREFGKWAMEQDVTHFDSKLVEQFIKQVEEQK